MKPTKTIPRHKSGAYIAAAAFIALTMLFATPVFAESHISAGGYKLAKTDKGDANLTIYGRVSPGLRYSHRPVDRSRKEHTALDSGTRGGDRLGFIGDIGLPEGFRAGFVLETGLSLDSGKGNGRWNRQAFASVSHENCGRLALGRIPTPQWRFIDRFDPFEDAYDPLAANVYIFNSRFDNSIMYDSPTWNGFTFTAGASKDTAGNRVYDRSPDAGNVQAVVLNPRYNNGPVSSALFLTYHKLKNDNGHRLDGESVFALDLFGGYDFGPVKLTGMFGLREASDTDFIMGSAINLNSRATRTVQWQAGMTIPVIEEKSKVMASYTGRRMSLADEDSKAYSHMFSLGYVHVFNRYVRVHAGYAYIMNNSTARSISGLATVPGTAGFQSIATIGASFTF